jgi:hypothetical protein
MRTWTDEAAEQELNELIDGLGAVSEAGSADSAEYMRWKLRAVTFFREVFGENSLLFRTFVALRWRYSGTMFVHFNEVFRPGATQQRYDMPAFLEALDKARGILLAAGDELERQGVEGVYQGKDTGPEASLLLRIMNLAERKLRKLIRAKPQKEREVQDAFEDLLVGADIEYSREKVSIEYSSKSYIPDFTVQKADLAIDIKLATAQAHEKSLIAEINDDIVAYRTKYGNLFFIVYDCGIIRDIDRFISSFEVTGTVYVRVVKH